MSPAFGDPFWVSISAEGQHPTGVNTQGQEHWAIRRWVSDYSGSVTISGQLSVFSADGTEAFIYINGINVSRSLVESPTDDNYSIALTLNQGDVVDFAISPRANDIGDNSKFTATIVPRTVRDPEVESVDIVVNEETGITQTIVTFEGGCQSITDSVEVEGLGETLISSMVTVPKASSEGEEFSCLQDFDTLNIQYSQDQDSAEIFLEGELLGELKGLAGNSETLQIIFTFTDLSGV